MNNGLTASPATNFKLGGTLVNNTIINTGTEFYLKVEGIAQTNSIPKLWVYQSGAPQTGPTLKVETATDNSSTAVEIAAAGHGLDITSAGIGITATSGNLAGYFNKTSSGSESVIVQRTFSTGTGSILTIKNGPSVLTTNSVVGLKIEHLAAAVTPDAGYGSSIRFASSIAANGASIDTMDISSTLIASGDDKARYKLQLSNGTSLTTRMEIEGATGQATLNAYGDWTFSDLESDTYTSFLATNSNGKVIEQNPTKFIKFGKTGAQNLTTPPGSGTNISITPTKISFDNPLVGIGLTPSISIVGANTFQNTSTRPKFFHIDWSLPVGNLQDKGYWLTVWFGTTGNPLGGHYEQGILLEQVAGETQFGGGAQNVIARGSGIVQLVPGTSYALYAVGVFSGNPASLFTVNNWSRAAAEGLTNTYFWEPQWDGSFNMSASISFIELGYATPF